MTMPTMPPFAGPPVAELQSAFDAPTPTQPTANLGQAAAPMQLSAEQTEALIKKLSQSIDYSQNAVRPYYDKTEEWLELFNVIPKAKNKPWPGSSNFPVPFLAEKVMSIHARLVRAIFNVDPIWLLKPRIKIGTEVVQQVEAFFDYLIDRGNYKQTLDMAILYSLIEGTAIVKIDYKRTVRTIQSSNPQLSQSMGTLNADSTTEEFVDFEGPRATFVPLKDFVVLPIEKFDLDDAQGAGHRFYLTPPQLKARESAGIYTNTQELIDKKAQGERPTVPATPLLGEIPEPPAEVIEPFELWEMFFKYDLNDDGNEVPILVTFSKEAEMILRVIPYPYDHGRAPYVPIRPMPQPNLFYGAALSQFLEPIQKELTASFQRRADALARATLPPILRMRGSAWNPAEEPLQPGGVITVNDPGEITTLQLPDYRQSNVSHEQMLQQLGERLTGISDYQLGRSAGSNRTFGEVRSVLAEGEVRIDVLLARIHESMKRMAELTFDIAYQFLPVGGMALVAGTAFQVDRMMLRPPGIGFEAYEFIPNGAMSEASREQQLERTLVMTNQIMQNPLLMSPELNPQAPMIAAMLMKKVMILAGWHDWETYLPQIAQYQQAMQGGQPTPMEQQQQQQAQQSQMGMQLEAEKAQAEILMKKGAAAANFAKAGTAAVGVAQQMGGGNGQQ